MNLFIPVLLQWHQTGKEQFFTAAAQALYLSLHGVGDTVPLLSAEDIHIQQVEQTTFQFGIQCRLLPYLRCHKQIDHRTIRFHHIICQIPGI